MGWHAGMQVMAGMGWVWSGVGRWSHVAGAFICLWGTGRGCAPSKLFAILVLMQGPALALFGRMLVSVLIVLLGHHSEHRDWGTGAPCTWVLAAVAKMVCQLNWL